MSRMLSQARPQVNDSITVDQLQHALETVDTAAKAYFHTQNRHIRQEFLLVIDTFLPEGYTRYLTKDGLVIECNFSQIKIYPERIIEDGICPKCSGDLLRLQPLDVDCRHRETVIVIRCGCGQFYRIIEKRRI